MRGTFVDTSLYTVVCLETGVVYTLSLGTLMLDDKGVEHKTDPCLTIDRGCYKTELHNEEAIVLWREIRLSVHLSTCFREEQLYYYDTKE